MTEDSVIEIIPPNGGGGGGGGGKGDDDGAADIASDCNCKDDNVDTRIAAGDDGAPAPSSTNAAPLLNKATSNASVGSGDSAEEKKVDVAAETHPTVMSPSKDSTNGNGNVNDGERQPTDLSSPRLSPFRQSLDAEAKARDADLQARRARDEASLYESRRLLRDSLASLSVHLDEGTGQPMLTDSERHFLGALLDSDGPGAAEACASAYRRLTDGNLFFWSVCGGSAGEVPGGLIPGHGWTTASHARGMVGEDGEKLDGVEDGGSKEEWVQNWVRGGGGENPKSYAHGREREEGAKNVEAKVQDQPPARERAVSTTSLGSSTNSDRLRRPYDLLHKSSSARRLSRLESRRRQARSASRGGGSSDGSTTSRLFRAHEAGLVVTPGGSARRSLMRMGLPMERGLYQLYVAPSPAQARGGPDDLEPPVFKYKGGGGKVDPMDLNGVPPALPQSGDEEVAAVDGASRPNTKVLSGDFPMSTQVDDGTFEKALAKMDERTIRRIEREERAKQKGRQDEKLRRMDTPTDIVSGGCISPFSMAILRKMFASKQASFHGMSGSSYSRFDSFLSTSQERLDSFLTSSKTTASSADESAGGGRGEKDSIFRRPASSEERLKNLLVNAGFKRDNEDDDGEDDEGLVTTARTEDDVEIMSTNTVAMLTKQGGPSYSNVTMFRGESEEGETKGVSNESPDKVKKEPYQSEGELPSERAPMKKIQVKVMNSSLVSSLGSVLGSIKMNPSDEEKDSDIACDGWPVGDLPSLSSGRGRSSTISDVPPHRRTSSTKSIIKQSSFANLNGTTSPSNSPSKGVRGKYKRSISWGHMVFSKGEVRETLSAAMREDSVSSGLSFVSFPNLGRAAPVRSDSIGSNASGLLSFPPPLKLGAPLRSESIGSMASMLSAVPSLARAHPVHSPRHSIDFSSAAGRLPFVSQLSRANSVHSAAGGMGRPPFVSQLSRAHSVHSAAGGSTDPPFLSDMGRARAVRSDSQMTMTTAVTSDDIDSLNSEDYVDAKPATSGAAWQSPLVSNNRPPLHGAAAARADNEHKVFIRQASYSNYEGIGMEVEEAEIEAIDKARKNRSLISQMSDYSLSRSISRRSMHSRNSSLGPPMNSVFSRDVEPLDDSFIIKNINFERHSNEILRSLSNEDLYSSHHLETINGGSSAAGMLRERSSSTARVFPDVGIDDAEEWDLDSNYSFNRRTDAWDVLGDEYAVGYGALGLPFRILGTNANDTDCHPHVMSPPLMESLSNFVPPTISENNFWLKYSLVRDGASLPSLLRHIRGTKHTLISIETVDGEVFGSFTSSPWRKNWNYYGSGESFLWRMRRTRSERDHQFSILDQAKLESELDVFYWTGKNDMVQYCNHNMIAVGGGSLRDTEPAEDVDGAADTSEAEQRDSSPPVNHPASSNEHRELPPPANIEFTKADKGGFGLAIDDELLRGTSSSCATFNSPPLSRLHADGSPFEILNIEVWTMTPFETVADAEMLEMKNLFLEPYQQRE